MPIRAAIIRARAVSATQRLEATTRRAAERLNFAPKNRRLLQGRPGFAQLGKQIHDRDFPLSGFARGADPRHRLLPIAERPAQDPSTDELRYMAAKALLPEKPVVSTALGTVDRFRTIWERERATLPLAANVIEAVDQNSKALAIIKEA